MQHSYELASVGFICYRELYLLGSHCLVAHIQKCGGIHCVMTISSAEKLISNPFDLTKYIGEQKIWSRFPKVGLFKNKENERPFIFPEPKDQANKTLASDLELSLGLTTIIKEHSKTRFLSVTCNICDANLGKVYQYDVISKSFEEAKKPRSQEAKKPRSQEADGVEC
jgi:hypothetical protein